MPRPKSSPFNKDNRLWIEEQRAKRLERDENKRAGSWWLDLPRDQFQAEVKRRHACLFNSRNPSDRSLSKPI